jgi:hypothetical protein
MSSALQDGHNLLTASLSTPSTTVRTKSVNVIKVPRLIKSSVEPYRSTTIFSAKIQPTRNPYIDLNGSGRTRMNQRSAANVSVTRVKRSSSAGQINHTNQRTTTASSNRNDH